MFKPPRAPYITPSSDVVASSPWRTQSAFGGEELPDFLPSWSQGSDLTIERELEIDRERLAAIANLPSDVDLAICVVWFSEAARIRRCVMREPIRTNRNTIAVNLPGDELGGRVIIETLIVLNRPLKDVEPWIAHEVGSVLLRDRVAVTLEGDGASFPIAIVDFAASIYPRNSSWFLETSSDPSNRFSATFQVLVNERDKKLVKAIESSNKTKEQSVLLDELMNGVMAQVIEFAYLLRAKGILEEGGYEEGTVGDVLSTMLSQVGDVEVEMSDDTSTLSRKRSVFEALARDLGAGRILE